ncbi:MAG: hypothetical protein ACPGEF_04135, partial [Endozoicomonas sp.]
MQSSQPISTQTRNMHVYHQSSFSENAAASADATAPVNTNPRLEPEAETGRVWSRRVKQLGAGALQMYLPRGEDGHRHLNMTSVAVSALFVISGATLYLYLASGAELAITLTPELISH